MNFHPAKLPVPMQAVWVQGSSYWRELVLAAARVGLFDIDFVTSAVFYLRHPERAYRPIARNETALIGEWKSWRVQVEGILSSRPPGRAGRATFKEFTVTKKTDAA